MKVILYQMAVVFGDTETNFQKIENSLINMNIESGSLLLLPELFLTGYNRQEIEKTAFQDDNGFVIDKLKKLANQYGITIYGSVAELDNHKYYNTGVFINSNGLLSKYRKSHLFGPMGEKQLFSRGNTVSTVNDLGTTIGLSICYDLRFPNLYQSLAMKDTEIVLVVAEWPNTRINHWISLLQARAIENQIFVIGLNRVGSDPDYTYGGHSMIFSPYGDFIAGFEHEDEDILTTDIELSLVNQFRNKFDVRKDKIRGIDY